ncbi:uncharacterized protein MEPE_06360 [Melanopsichium pennsylvanicum]|uniref:Uncharacterized protein n=2 Tax=Melanopsichium pennsylvanicum TaxID=63383 RepID=A0AAJ4XRQ9_9BASI|nr:putative protein [Melanopsichium pennsylvanicum 4]SNX87650.1 uncharacterized protein MEPE_06360 [Melanopsichium pennsylvanicum]
MLNSPSPTSFDHRVSAQELKHLSDILENSHFATHNGQVSHLIVLALRVIFCVFSNNKMTDDQEQISLVHQLILKKTTNKLSKCKISFDARLKKVVRLDKVLLLNGDGLKIKFRKGQEFLFENVIKRDEVFNCILALAPQKWH